MPEARVELARGCPRRILSPLRLPFRHSGFVSCKFDCRGLFGNSGARYALVSISTTQCSGCPSEVPASVSLIRMVMLEARS